MCGQRVGKGPFGVPMSLLGPCQRIFGRLKRIVTHRVRTSMRRGWMLMRTAHRTRLAIHQFMREARRLPGDPGLTVRVPLAPCIVDSGSGRHDRQLQRLDLRCGSASSLALAASELADSSWDFNRACDARMATTPAACTRWFWMSTLSLCSASAALFDAC